MTIYLMTGPMFDGKTEWLIEKINEARLSDDYPIISTPIFKCVSQMDLKKRHEPVIKAHSSKSNDDAVSVQRIVYRSDQIWDYMVKHRVKKFFINEVQFLDDCILDLVDALKGYDGYIEGISTDFSGEAFPFLSFDNPNEFSYRTMGDLMAKLHPAPRLADKYAKCAKVKLIAKGGTQQGRGDSGSIQRKCGARAIYTQRLENGEPSKYGSMRIISSESDGKAIYEGKLISYEPRCESCHEVPGKPSPRFGIEELIRPNQQDLLRFGASKPRENIRPDLEENPF